MATRKLLEVQGERKTCIIMRHLVGREGKRLSSQGRAGQNFVGEQGEERQF